jgi:hypothetical protein
MLVELMLIDVEEHQFGLVDLEIYVSTLDQAIFKILQNEIYSRVRNNSYESKLSEISRESRSGL